MNTNNLGSGPFLVIPFAIIAIVSLWWHMSRSRSLLELWAQENGLAILNSQRRYLMRGPFFWTTGKGQEVFFVTVRDAGGQVRKAYVRCGGFWMGLLSDNVDVNWED